MSQLIRIQTCCCLLFECHSFRSEQVNAALGRWPARVLHPAPRVKTLSSTLNDPSFGVCSRLSQRTICSQALPDEPHESDKAPTHCSQNAQVQRYPEECTKESEPAACRLRFHFRAGNHRTIGSSRDKWARRLHHWAQGIPL